MLCGPNTTLVDIQQKLEEAQVLVIHWFNKFVMKKVSYCKSHSPNLPSKYYNSLLEIGHLGTMCTNAIAFVLMPVALTWKYVDQLKD